MKVAWAALKGRQLGAFKTAAAKIGVPFEEYQRLIGEGQKWCTACKDWHKEGDFNEDPTRWDGLSASCANSRRVVDPKPYRGGRPKGLLVETRDGDKAQARYRVNYLVATRQIPPANTVPCTDCGQVWQHGLPRHEYDHFKGYGSENQLSVQSVCQPCHRLREERRGAIPRRKRGYRGRYV